VAQINVTKMSSKGQVVIPKEMREDIVDGEKLVIIRNGHQIIIEKEDFISETLEADLEFARKTEEAWQSYEKGDFKKMPVDEFLKEIERW